jgi:glutathione S-transferase
MRSLFYPEQVTGPGGAPFLVAQTKARIGGMLDLLEAAEPSLAPWLGAERSSLLDCYLCSMLRWLAVYPQGSTEWFDLARWPRLLRVAARMEARPEALAASGAEGLGHRPFTRPSFPRPPEGGPL